MKIAHLSTAHGWRGGEQQCLNLAKGLACRGIDQFIIAQPDSPLHKHAASFGIETRELRTRGELDIFAYLKLRQILKREKADIIHAHDAHAAAYAAISGSLAGIKKIATRRVDFALKRSWKYRKLDKVICISKAVHDICRDGGVPEDKLVIVYSGIDPDRLLGNYNRKEMREQLGLDRRDDIILNVASLTDHKGQCYLLEAMLEIARQNSRAHLLIAGTGELEEELKRQTTELALDDKVHFLGFRKDVGALMDLADVFVMSSHLEGLCTSVLDAMACERAVVVTEAGGMPELVGDADVGLVVEAKNPEALAEAVTQLLNDHKRRSKMGIRGRKRVLENFTLDHTADGTVAEYKKLLR